MRNARPDDVGLVGPLLQLGYPNVEWNEGNTRDWLEQDGVHIVNVERRAYLLLSINPNLETDIGPPMGLCTQVSALLPQHHDQAWVDEVLAPLLARGLRKVGRENPQLRTRPVYAYLPPDLLPFWTHIFTAETTARSSGSHVIWLPTLQGAIAKVAGI